MLGNNDGPDVAEWGAPRTAELDLDGLKVSMVHDSGATKGRGGRMHRRFPNAAIVVYGHSHLPDDSVSEAGQRQTSAFERHAVYWHVTQTACVRQPPSGPATRM